MTRNQLDQETHDILTLLNSVSQRLDMLSLKVNEVDARVLEIEKMALKYKGGFVTILSLGALTGWIVSNLEWLKNIFDVR